MGQYKTTPEDFRIFQEAVAYWQRRLGLLNWQIYTRHKTRDRNDQASCYPNLAGRCATLCLSKVLYNHDESPGETYIRRVAFHQVCEVFMARMLICATACCVTGKEIDEARYGMICNPGAVIFDAEVGGDAFHRKKLT